MCDSNLSKKMFDAVISELKQYREKEHGSYCYPYLYKITYCESSNTKKPCFRIIQVSGWKFIYSILKPKKSSTYPTVVYYDYMKSHLDYLKQLPLSPNSHVYNRFTAYYNSNIYSKWFPEDELTLAQQLENIEKCLIENQKKRYYEELISFISKQLQRKGIIRLSTINNRMIYSYLV